MNDNLPAEPPYFGNGRSGSGALCCRVCGDTKAHYGFAPPGTYEIARRWYCREHAEMLPPAINAAVNKVMEASNDFT